LDDIAARGIDVHAVGQHCDIYCGHGIASSVRVTDNRDAMEKTFDLLDRVDRGFIFVNLNDFDSKYGHRRNVRGYASALEELDLLVPRLESLMKPEDEVVFTADHGCDPTAAHTDHTREYVPLLARFGGGRSRRHDGPLADVGASVLWWLAGRVSPELPGDPFVRELDARAA